MKKAVQMYAVRALAKENLKLALETASKIGYEGVEFAGFGDASAEEVASWLKEYNLEAMSAHVAPEIIFDDTENMIKYHKTIGNRRIVCPWYDLKTKEDVLRLAEKLNAVYPKLKENGMELYYHNHAHEFEKADGEYLLDILAEAVPEMKLEFDVYWVYRGGENPVAYFEKYKDRIDIFHAKDGIGDKGTTLHKGAVDLDAVFKFAKEHNMPWAVVESEAEEDRDLQVKAIEEDYRELLKLL